MPKIPALPNDSQLSTGDYLVIDDGSTTYKIPISDTYASASNPGLVSTGAQAFMGVKTFENGLSVKASGEITSPAQFIYKNSDGASLGNIQLNVISKTLFFLINSLDSSTNKPLGFYDLYKLPSVSEDKTANNTYDILTSKNPVSIQQGGTGSTGRTVLPKTYTPNDYCSETAFNRCVAETWGKIVLLRFNLMIDKKALPSVTDLFQIGSFGDISLSDQYTAIVTAQNGSGHILLQISQSGVLSIGNYSGTSISGFCRAVIPLMLA